LITAVGVEDIVRVILWFTLVFQALISVTQVVLQLSRCGHHIAALWDSTIHVKCVPYVAVIDYLYFLAGLYPYSRKLRTNALVAWNAFTDLFLVILPFYLLKDVKLELRNKILTI